MTPQEALALLEEASGRTARFVRKFDHGNEGAYLVEEPDGRQWVLKWAHGDESAPRWHRKHQTIQPLLERLSMAGYPIPRQEPPLLIGNTSLLLQELAPGAPSDAVDPAFVDTVCDLIELQGGVAEDLAGSWGEKVVETLTNGGFRHSHEPLINHGSRTRSISRRIKEIASTLDPLMFADGDVVHGDFDHRNVLREDGTVTAVIDWDSFTCVGDRYFDLATLVYSLEFAELDADTETYALQRLTSTVEPAVFAAYAAYLSLRFCTWMLVYQQGREDYDDWLERFLSRSERWLDVADNLLAGAKP